MKAVAEMLGVRVRSRGSEWVITYRWPRRRGEKRRTKVDPKRFRDKRNAQRHADRMLDAVEVFEAGRGPDPFETASSRTLDVGGYLAALAAGAFARKGKGKPAAEHVSRTKERLALMLDRFGLSTAADMEAFGDDAAVRFATLQEAMKAPDTERVIERRDESGKWVVAETLRGWDDKTRDEHVLTLRQFSGWLLKRRVLTVDPVGDVPLLAGEASVTFKRVALAPDDVGALMAAAEAAGEPDRAVLWAFAIFTGYRAGECRAVTWADVVLDDGNPRVELSGCSTKNRQDAVQPIPVWLGDRLRSMRRRRRAMPTARVFDRVDFHNIVRSLRHDGVAAGLGQVERRRSKTKSGQWSYWTVWIDPRGLKHTLDFHSLRHTYATMVGRTAISPNDARDLSRHADERTARRYWHADVARQRAIVDALPVPEGTTTRATTVAPGGAESDTA